ncbi:molybdate transporter subunit; ATP-binding component of ABC superfamily [Rubrivivax sp. A210]|uniref:molybdenum ABC transporter ATP-binding protein n=1 Tax=Rubrivivax sp. A210 TaxID=2772301 RepID=UPI0019180FD1|nr:molybdenum ABC transporter ATP-binding protein [Rubrivivax sp. A210]CAD5371966.1 molybdate transporter subunit; ATP-binding component of ABC superfamily [Rubrivivax sp. A210]
MIDIALRLPRRGFVLEVALQLPARGVSALFGPSGCGKTTVLRALAGLERAAGHVRLGDETWQDDARGLFVPTHRRALGYVIQEAALFPHLSVQRNLDYGLKRIAPALRRVPLDQVVALLGISALMDRRPATLSGGERQRVAIARALATSPRLLLMDEPLAALDAERKAEVLPYIEGLQRELGLPIVYVSHALDEVARLADQLVLLRAGRVLAQGPVPEMLARLDLPLPLGEDAGVVLQGVVGERDAQWQLARLDVDEDPQGGGACGLWARDHGLPLGRRVRLRVLARDVSLTRAPQTGTSIGNQLRATVEAIADDSHPALALVRVRVGKATPLVARLTRRSAHALQLVPGQEVWAQVKTVALME